MWARRGVIALVLAVIVAGCGVGGVTLTGPIETSTQTPVPVPSSGLPPISPTVGTSSIGGEYKMTITASPNCSLPPEVRQRTYVARVAETRPGYFTVTLRGADFSAMALWGHVGFEGRRDGDVMRFVIGNGDGGDYYFIERIDATRNLIYEGVAGATIGDKTIAGNLNGEIRYFATGDQPWLGDCVAADHRIVFAR